MSESSPVQSVMVQSFIDFIRSQPQRISANHIDPMFEHLILNAGYELEDDVFVLRQSERLELTIHVLQTWLNSGISTGALLDQIRSCLSKVDVDKKWEDLIPDGVCDASLFKTLRSYFKTVDGMDDIYNEMRAKDEECAVRLENLFPDHPETHAPDEGDLRQQSEGGLPVKDLTQLYEEAENFLGGFKCFLERIGRDAALQVLVAPLKGKIRAQEKISSQYLKQVRDGKKLPVPAAWLYDVVRGALVVGSGSGDCLDLSKLLKAYDVLKAFETNPEAVKLASGGQLEKIKILRAKNRFRNPAEGYRDINMNISLFRNGYRHTTEVQFKLGVLKPLSDEQHHYYEDMRTYFQGGIRNSVKDRFVRLSHIRELLDDPNSEDMSLIVDTVITKMKKALEDCKNAGPVVGNLIRQKLDDTERQMEVLEGLLDLLDEKKLRCRILLALVHSHSRPDIDPITDTKVAFWLQCAATLLEKSSCWDTAAHLHKTLFATVMAQTGKHSCELASAHAAFADSLTTQSNFNDAERHYLSALKITSGGSQPLLRADISMRFGAFFLRRCLTELEDTDWDSRLEMLGKAYSLTRPACDEIKMLCGRNSPEFAEATLGLGLVLGKLWQEYKDQQYLKECLDTLRRALEVNEEAFGQRSHQVMESLYRLAAFDIPHGEFLAARAVQIEIAIFSLKSPAVQLRYFNVAINLLDANKVDELLGFEVALNWCLEALSNQPEADYRGRMRGNSLLGQMLRRQANHEEALHCFSTAVSLEPAFDRFSSDDKRFLTTAKHFLFAGI